MDLMFNFYRDEPRHPGERIFLTRRVFLLVTSKRREHNGGTAQT